MRISIWPGAEHPYSEVLSMARHAAETGWDGIWFADHFMPDGRDDAGPILECGSVVAALGATVPRVRIGTLVYGNTYRHPAVVANMAATADRISDGRFVLGIGAGWQINEHRQYGITLPPVRERIDRFEEAVQITLGLLRQPRTTFEGRYYRVTDAACEPKPVQDPLPVMIGAKGEKRMLGIVAKYADLWNAWGALSLIAHKSAVLDRFCAELGRDPRAIDRTAQALVSVGEPVPGGPGGPPVIGGSPARFADAVAEYREIGLDELIIPDELLGTGAARLAAMDTILAIVRS
jgi:alkanesulfonate monooxygenase SsuD/methylene tetrahydromethanopterin reductase-like flavin-dependent oxidoreductase (luciferase family)